MPRLLPPLADALNGEGRRVVVDPDGHPTGICRDIVDPIRGRASEFGNLEIIDTDLFRLSLRLPVPTTVLEVSHEFLLLGVHRDDGLARTQGGLSESIDVGKLGVTVRRSG